MLSLMRPLQLAGFHIVGKEQVGGDRGAFATAGTLGSVFDALRDSAVKQAFVMGKIAPLEIRFALAGNLEFTHGLAGGGIELEAFVVEQHEEVIIARGHVAGLA